MRCTPTTGGYTGGRRRTNYLLVWSARQQVRTLSYDVPVRTTKKKPRRLKKTIKMHACTRPDGKAPELHEKIATDDTLFLLVGMNEIAKGIKNASIIGGGEDFHPLHPICFVSSCLFPSLQLLCPQQ